MSIFSANIARDGFKGFFRKAASGIAIKEADGGVVVEKDFICSMC